jgi:4-amino-4-deoxy-L-arabinose transferase-like glycosyltransferase
VIDRPSAPPKSAFGDIALIALIWCAFMASAVLLRPLLPIDETRYVTVAWEMWTNHNFLVPHLNGELYSHKPPLLFWLMKLGWLVFGVSEAWARLVAPLFALASLWLTAKLARELWPQEQPSILANRAVLAPLMMACGLYWTVFSTLIMFDMMLTAAAILAVLGYVKAWKGFVAGRGFWTGLLIAALGLGLGGMAKGPAILVHTLPLALAAPLWGPALTHGRGQTTWGKWYWGVLASALLGTALVLGWAIPAAIVGGAEYRDAIFIKQSTERMVESFAHRRPFYWFVWVLPLMLLPWTVWPRLWRSIGARKAWREGRGLRPTLAQGGVRVVLVWFGASFVIFSAISGKQPHYLLPVFPALALFAAHMLSQRESSSAAPAPAPQNGFGHRLPVIVLGAIALMLLILGLAKENIEPLLKSPLPDWAGAAQTLWLLPAVLLAGAAAMRQAQGPKAEARLIAVTVVGLMVFLHLAAAPAFSLAYDLGSSAQQIKSFQDTNRPVAYIGKYHGEFQFLGRLESPITALDTMNEGRAWAKANPTGVIVATMRERDIPATSKPLSIRPYRGRVLVMWDAPGF